MLNLQFGAPLLPKLDLICPVEMQSCCHVPLETLLGFSLGQGESHVRLLPTGTFSLLELMYPSGQEKCCIIHFWAFSVCVCVCIGKSGKERLLIFCVL